LEVQKPAKKYFLKLTLLILSFFLLALNLGSCGGGGEDGGSNGALDTWAKTFGGSGSDIAYSLQQTADGGFIVTGETSSFGVANSDIWLLKLDASGSLQWQKTYGGTLYERARSLQQISDGGFVLAGETSSFGINTDLWILKLDSSGNVIWQNTYGSTGVDKAYAIQQTSNGGFIVAGETSSFSAAGSDFWVLKINSDGSVDWQKRYGGNGDDVARAIQRTSDDGFIVAGESTSLGTSDKDIWILKLDSTGGIEWQKSFGEDASEDSAYSVQQTADGGFIVAGETITTGLGDAWILKLDASGGIQWQKTFGEVNSDSANSIQETWDGGFIVAGGSYSFSTHFGDIWILKLNSSGEIVWQKIYGGNYGNSAYFIRQISGGYIVAGVTSAFGVVNSDDFWVLKIDDAGNIGSGCSITGASSATVTSPTVPAINSSISANDTNSSVTPTSVSPQNSNATTATQCSSQ